MQLRIESSSGVPMSRQIADQIRTQCASGILVTGERLPSVRELARQLVINQNTVLRVYEKLTGEGFLERRHGDGTYIADRLPGGQGRQFKAQRRMLQDEFRRLVSRARLLGVEAGKLHELLDVALADGKRIPAPLEK